MNKLPVKKGIRVGAVVNPNDPLLSADETIIPVTQVVEPPPAQDNGTAT
ncbi:hypothetical protein A2U01_0118502, partial [Trifolium medium]|nr:hypothetical protein [Trifolium medium]